MQYTLSPHIRAGHQGNTLFYSFGSTQQIIKDERIQKEILEASTMLQNKTTKEELKNKFKEETLQRLEKANAFIPAESYEKKKRYSRHQLYFQMSGAEGQDVQTKIKNSHVVVLGCGGIGNLFSTVLATGGVGQITLVDQDEVELSNLTRQFMFTENDINEDKIEVLKRELQKRNSEVEINTLRAQLKTKEDLAKLPKADLIVVSADSGCILEEVNAYCVENGTAWVNVGYVEDVAVWGPFIIPAETGCFECHNHIADDYVENELTPLLKQVNKTYQAPSTGPINMMATSFAAMDVFKYLGGFGEIQSLNKRVGIWTHNLKIETQDFSKNHQCQRCRK